MFDFEFIINNHFKLQGGQVGFTGTMIPVNMPIITIDKYDIKLLSKGKIIHTFKNIGEEIPSRSNMNFRARAFRTTDNINEILDKMLDLSIVGIKK